MKTLLLVSLGLIVTSSPVLGQSAPVVMVEPPTHEAAIVDGATAVLGEIMAVPAKAIPKSLLANAEGIAIVPGLVKGGFIVGVRHGRGVVVVRDEAGRWVGPTFISITGGSVGWQIGIQATDVILVFKTRNSVKGLLNGKFTIGAGVSAAAGPVGREASAATDAALRAEIYSYSRSRGIFAGASLDGSAIQTDSAATATYYRPAVAVPAGQAAPPPQVPPSAERLLKAIAYYTAVASNVGPAAPVVVETRAVDVQTARRQLANASQRLDPLLDDNWRRYLALPPEIRTEGRQPSSEAVAAALARFGTVAQNPQYQALAARPEFQETFNLLRQYSASQSTSTTLRLPPPPR